MTTINDDRVLDARDMGKEIVLTFTDVSLPIAQPVAEFEVDLDN